MQLVCGCVFQVAGGTFSLGPRSLAAGVKARTWPKTCVSLRLLLEEFLRVFLSFVLAQFALGIWYIISVSLSLAVIIPGVWVLPLCMKVGFFGR